MRTQAPGSPSCHPTHSRNHPERAIEPTLPPMTTTDLITTTAIHHSHTAGAMAPQWHVRSLVARLEQTSCLRVLRRGTPADDCLVDSHSHAKNRSKAQRLQLRLPEGFSVARRLCKQSTRLGLEGLLVGFFLVVVVGDGVPPTHARRTPQRRASVDSQPSAPRAHAPRC